MQGRRRAQSAGGKLVRVDWATDRDVPASTLLEALTDDAGSATVERAPTIKRGAAARAKIASSMASRFIRVSFKS
jgi:hypothetical protein